MAEKVNGLSEIMLQSSLTRIIAFRNVVDAIKAISCFSDLSPKRQEHLEKVIKDNFSKSYNKKLLDVCWTRWLERIDGVDLFEYLFLAIIMTLKEIFFHLEGKYNKGTSVKASSLLKLILNFDFIARLVISRHILDYTNFMTQIMEGKNNDIIKGLNPIKNFLNMLELARNDSDNKNNKWYQF